jgi:UDP-glucose 4-epimerase
VSDEIAFGRIPDVDFIFHLAARARIAPSFGDPSGYFRANATGTMVACKFALDKKIPLVYAGTGSYHGGRYRNPYTFSKAVGEDVVRMHMGMGLNSSIARFFNVYGPGESKEDGVATLVGSWRGKREKGEIPVIYGDGSKTRDFTHVDDITDALILIMHRGAWGHEFDLGRGSPKSVLEISEMFGGEFRHLPDRPGEVQNSSCDLSLARDVLGWRPYRNVEDYVRSLCINRDTHPNNGISCQTTTDREE